MDYVGVASGGYLKVCLSDQSIEPMVFESHISIILFYAESHIDMS